MEINKIERIFNMGEKSFCFDDLDLSAIGFKVATELYDWVWIVLVIRDKEGGY
jgi:hypothetical protein